MTEDAPTYRFWLLESTTGLPIGELANVSGVHYTEVLNGYGTASLTIPLDDPIGKVFPQTITETQWIFTFKGPGLIGKTDLLIVRDSKGGAAVAGGPVPVFNGPIVSADLSLSDRTATFTAHSVFWLFTKRICDFARNYKNWDPFDVCRDAWYYATHGKEWAGGMTGFYNFLVDWTTKAKDILNVYHKVNYGFAVTDGRTLDQVFKDMSGDPAIGFDFRVDLALYNTDPNYLTPSQGQNRVFRGLTFGWPQFFRMQAGVLSPATGLVDLSQNFDLDTSATHVWVYGASVGTTRKSGHYADLSLFLQGYPLLEESVDKSDISDQNLLNSMAKTAQNVMRPPGWVATATYRPSYLLPWDYYRPGDIINVNVSINPAAVAGWQQLSGMLPDGDIQYKVVSKETTILDDGTDRVALTLNNPLTDTST